MPSPTIFPDLDGLTLEQAQAKLCERFPKRRIAGLYEGGDPFALYFRPLSAPDEIRAVRATDRAYPIVVGRNPAWVALW